MCYENECYLIETGHSFKDKARFTRGNYIHYKDLSTFCKQCNNFSVFRSAYKYSTTDIENSKLYGDLYLDFDDEKDFDKVRMDVITSISYFKVVYHIVEDYLKIYFSGKKGIHLIVPAEVLGVTPVPMLNHVFKYIANSVRSFTPNKTIDIQIYDNKRLFRVPNTIHENSGLYKVPLTLQEIRTLSIDELKHIAEQPRIIEDKALSSIIPFAQQQFQRAVQEYQTFSKVSNKDYKYYRILDFTPPCIQSILDNGAEEGQRNITIACLACFCRNSGKSLNESIAFISDWNDRNIKPTGEQELKKTIRSIFNGNKLFGCSTLRTISTCSKSQCKLSKKG